MLVNGWVVGIVWRIVMLLGCSSVMVCLCMRCCGMVLILLVCCLGCGVCRVVGWLFVVLNGVWC